MIPHSYTDDEHNDGVRQQPDGGINGSTLVLSLYLIDSEDDLLHLTQGYNDVKKRARLYKRLCQACTIANDILRRSSSPLSKDNGKFHDDPHTKYYPWSSGGDGPIFGVHCNVHSDEEFNDATFGIDGDDLWQSQSPTQSDENTMNDNIEDDRQRENGRTEINENPIQQQPHLRAICRYNNDVNDMWRCVSLALQISSALSNNNLSCAIECWDTSDGHILLIEAAEHLPAWVDDDELQGGVGGPKGCRNRCWIVNGNVHLIPPSSKGLPSCTSQQKEKSSSSSPSVDPVKELTRNDFLYILMKSIQRHTEISLTSHLDAVQSAIEHRINRTNYSRSRMPKHSSPEASTTTSHWHTAAAALPASVARFIQIHPYLVPFLVESFCDCAPAYLRDIAHCKRETRTCGGNASTVNDADSNKHTSNKNSPQPVISPTNYSFGNIFPYEELVLFPIIFTRTNYAELITGRGVVPTFPVPHTYRSVELNRFQRQLRQSAFGNDQLVDEDDATKKKRNPFNRAVDVGIRLCAGLDWILTNTNDRILTHFAKKNAAELENAAIDSLGEVERRIRIYWIMLDTEVTGKCDQTQLSWIEQAWQIGPNGSPVREHECAELLIQALESMSKCHVFNPELSKPLWKEPCPYTRPGLSVLEMAQSGIHSALNWQRRECNRDMFPIPRDWEVDDDIWMEVDSLEDLEDEMKNISAREAHTDSQQSAENIRPRRITRRSRRNLAYGTQLDVKDEQQVDHEQSANKMLAGIRSFVEGEGELEGAVTKNVTKSPNQPDTSVQSDVAIEPGNCQDVNINPRRFLNILHSMLSDQFDLGTSNGSIVVNEENDESIIDDNISKYFFQEDLDNGDMSDSECDSDDNVDDSENDNREMQFSTDQDPWSLQNIMEAMDHELRTDVATDPSIKYLSLSSDSNNVENRTHDSDREIITNLLSSLDAQGCTGPVSTILKEMGIVPPRQHAHEDGERL